MGCTRIASSSSGFFLLEVGLGASKSGGCPKTRPAAAAATAVPVPTSCREKKVSMCGLQGPRCKFRLCQMMWRSQKPQEADKQLSIERWTISIEPSQWQIAADVLLSCASFCPTCWVVFVLCEWRGQRGTALEWDCFLTATYTRHNLHLGCGLLCRRQRRRRAAVGGEEDERGFGTREGRDLHRQDITKRFSLRK